MRKLRRGNSFRCSTAGSRRWMASTIRDTRTIVCCSETNHPYVDRGDRCAGRERRDRADDPMGWRRSYAAAGEEEPSWPASLDYRRRRSRARHGARPSASRQGDCGDSQPRRQGDRSRQRMESIRASAGCAIIAGYRPIAMGLALSALFAPAANAQQQPTIFFCAAPAGHVCRFVVQTGATPIDFALLSGERSSSPALFRTRPSIVFVTPALSRRTAGRPAWTIGAWANGWPSFRA